MKGFVRLLTILAVSAPLSAYASECIGLAATTLLDQNDVVFRGVVTQIRLLDPDATVTATLAAGMKSAPRGQVAVTFKVAERYTARASTASSGNGELVLHQWAALGMTDYFHKYEVGHHYLVFASDNRQAATAGPAPIGIVSRACDAWDLTTPIGEEYLKELQAALRKR